MSESINYHIHQFDSIDSTNDKLKTMAEEGAEHGTVVTAKQQKSGRGRSDREWISPKGNMYASILIRPDADINLEQLSNLSFVSAIAAGHAIDELVPTSLPISFKWPNDILCSLKKMGGILLESSSPGKDNNASYVIVGIGINLAHFPEDMPYPATSLHSEAGNNKVTPEAMLEAFLDHFSTHYNLWSEQGFDIIKAQWIKRASHIGKEITIKTAHGEVTGKCETMDDTGALIMMSNGIRKRLNSGEIFFSE